MKRKKIATSFLAGLIGASLLTTSAFAFDGFTTYKGSNMVEYYGDYDSVNYPYEKLDAKFTTATVAVDGTMDEAYSDSSVSRIDNFKGKDGYGLEATTETFGELRTLWNGPDLYLLISVYDSCVKTSTETVPGATTNPAVAGETTVTYPYAGWGGFWDTWAVTTTVETCDSVALAVDLFDDRTTYELDTAGIVTIDALGNMYYYSSSNIPSLGSALGDPSHPEYMDIIKEYAAAPMYDDAGNQTGYCIEVCLSVEGTECSNGTKIGVDLKINDVNDVVTGYTETEIENPDYVEPEALDVSGDDVSGSDVSSGEIQEAVPQFITVQEPVYAIKKSADVFWSHNQDSLYVDFNHEHTNSTDWGEITLTGWNGTDEWAYSDWTLRKILRYIDSASFAKGVYTEATQARLDRAVSTAQVIVNSTSKDAALTKSAVKELKEAFDGLRWADTKYPDPAELTKQVTLPNTYKFFGSDKVVTNNEEWQARREEILDLAQFYEYGYKPDYDSLVITSASYHHKGDTYWRESHTNPGVMKQDTYKDTGAAIKANVTVGNVTEEISYDIIFPEDEAIASSGHEGEKLPIVLSYDGNISSYTNAGLAMITVPSVCSDTRTNEYAWNNRTGLFYELYPYARNGEAALKEVSNEMAEAWAASVVIDMLELCQESEDETIRNAVSAVDIEKLAVTGFSINGKYAFVAGVFDDRIDVVIPGAAGATGPSPWRYVYRGQEYDWTDTAYVNSQVDSYQVAWGTEVIANSVRHNRVRETEMFRKFMTPGHFYEFEENAYGYATRLPYDQNDLIATLAPRAIIIENTVNDYNDGCTADCLGAEVAKSVYTTLGYDADDLVKFNLRNLKTGDPHGNDSEQRGRSAEYLNYYFFGTPMSEETDTYLNTDPYLLKVSNNRTESPYDYYWGGFNTITGGKEGVDGTDGWYSYRFPVVKEEEKEQQMPDDIGSEEIEESDSSDDNDTYENTASDNKNTELKPVEKKNSVNAVPGRRIISTTPAMADETEEIKEIEEIEDAKAVVPEEIKKDEQADEKQEEIVAEEEENQAPDIEDETTNISEDGAPKGVTEGSSYTAVLIAIAVLLVAAAGFFGVRYYKSKEEQ